MTEAEWLKCRRAAGMLDCLGNRKSPRKLRLFAVGCCRRIAPIATGAALKTLEIAERFADNLASLDELRQAHHFISVIEWERVETGQNQLLLEPFVWATSTGAEGVDWVQFTRKSCERFQQSRGIKNEMARQCGLLRDIFGNPFRPPSFSAGWLTSTVKQLANSIYEERAFDRMPILGDALEEASCSNADILNHCREPGEHVKGCWVVDLILGKS